MSLPTTTDAWVVQGKDADKGLDNLKLERGRKIPELGEYDVLVQMQAVSLNYRDLVIPLVGSRRKTVRRKIGD
jgi:hypothetical protein